MRVLAASAALACAVTVAFAAGPSFDFMPDGGRGLFAQVFADPAKARSALANNATRDQWQAAITTAVPDLAAGDVRRLAGYLATIAPLTGLASAEDPATLLPPDGKDLALAHCQSCHSLFTGYLMQRRDDAGWRGIFKSPFHKGIALSEAEIATFADYSAVTMPLKFEDVPPELRF